MKLSSERENLYRMLEYCVGGTPLHKIEKIKVAGKNTIYAKEEWLNPTASLFARVYLHLFKNAEEKGFIIPGVTPVIEASTGNAGAAFAYYARELGYDAIVITHADTPIARVEQIRSYCGRVIFSPKGQYAKGYVKFLETILQKDKKEKGGKIGQNPERLYCVTKINPEAKVPLREVADETYIQLKGGKIDYFICVVGSGTTISGIGERLKEINPDTKIIALDHVKTPVLSHLKRGKIFDHSGDTMPHELFGMSAFGLPKERLDINFEIIDKIMLIDDDYWKEGCKLLQKKEKKPVGRSSGASLFAALKIAKKIKGKNILIIFFDAAWKYDNRYPYFK